MATVYIEVKSNVILGPKIKQFRTELLNQVAEDGALQMEAVTPRRTGRGANSYKVITRDENTREIRNDTFYLPYVDQGTGIYGPRHRRITPVHARYLHFHWKGQEWFLKSVKGQKPKRFVEKGVKDIVNSVDKIAVIAARRTLG